ncbi:uncharacterized protein LOC120636735 [Pararge aegeria]|uniref:uncharacterized protein LOC120636735 n=1 Tax=Pararge aegeria TaxID=116150 RepID=UPI0019CFC95D|nr:uncharacterized protein LOC120636735 [Pararge aegeria]
MEEVMNMLQKIQSELNEQKLTIVQSAENVTQQVTHNINLKLEEKFKIMEEKYNNLEEKLENQEKRLYFLEKQSRQRNIVIFGLAETETSYENSEENIKSFIKRYFSIELGSSEIQEIRRIGKKGEKTRPITVTFTTLGTKIRIYKQRKVLKNTDYYINEDFPQHILEKRKELREQMKIEREKGNYATIRYDKLIIRRNNADSSGNKKRTLPTSPGINDPTGILQGTQVNKKNKTQTKQELQRSSSLTEGVLKPGILGFLTNKNPGNPRSEQIDKNLKQ